MLNEKQSEYRVMKMNYYAKRSAIKSINGYRVYRFPCRADRDKYVDDCVDADRSVVIAITRVEALADLRVKDNDATSYRVCALDYVGRGMFGDYIDRLEMIERIIDKSSASKKNSKPEAVNV